MFRWTLVKRTIGMTFMVGGLFWFGMKGLLVGVVLYNWFCYFVNIGLVSKHIGYRWNKQLYDLLPVTIVVVIAAGISVFVGYFFHLSLYLDGLLKFMVFALIYVGWVLVFKPESYQYFLTIIPAKFRFFRKK